MSVLGQSKDTGANAVLPQAQGPTTGFFQNIRAGFQGAVAGPHSTRVGQAIYEKRYYDDIVKALAAEGEQGDDYVQSPVLRSSPFYNPVPGERVNAQGVVFVPVKRSFRNPYVSSPSLTKEINPITNLYTGGDQDEVAQIWAAVERVRKRKPDFLKQFPNAGAITALGDTQRKKDQAASQAVTSRAGGLGTVGGFVGGMAGSVTSMDPENFVAGGFGTAAGKSVARTVIKRAVEGAVANAAAATVAAPGQVADAEHMGEKMTTGDVVHQIAETAAVGAVIGGAHASAPHIARGVADVAGKAAGVVAENLPAPVRDAAVAASLRAGTVKDRALLTEYRRLHTPYTVTDTATPDERAAAHVIERDAEVRETSPFEPRADAAHQTRLSAIANDLGVNLTADAPSPAPPQTPTVKPRGAPREPATYEQAVHTAEGTGKNPNSSADGHFQFTKGTWLEYAPRVADTKGMSRQQVLALRHDLPTAQRAERLFRADNGAYLRARGIEDSPGNLSLAHFLGKSDAAKVLQADPSTPIEKVIDPKSFAANRKFLTGKSASEVVAWAHKRIGAAVDGPVARADAVPDEDFDATSPVPYTVETVRPDDVTANPDVFQYKSEANSLEGQEFNPILSQHIIVWEPEEGPRVVIDGHQRLELARRSGTDLQAVIVREADGISEQQARVLGALRNIANGTGRMEDDARVLQDAPADGDMPPNNTAEMKQATAVAQLPYDQFGEVLNGAPIPELRRHEGSWVVVDRKTGKPVMETPDRVTAARVNQGKYEILTAHEWLARYNAAVADAGGVEPSAKHLKSLVGEPSRVARHEPATAELQLADRGVEPDGGAGGAPVAEGRGFSDQAPDSELAPGYGTLFDHAVTARDRAEAFSDPVGEGAKAQTDNAVHDLAMDHIEGEPPSLFDTPETGYRLSEEGDQPQTLQQIMAEAESDEQAAKALRDCLKAPE